MQLTSLLMRIVVALTGSSPVVEISKLGLDRFDSQGRSSLATDPIALPFPRSPNPVPS
jgi:hypothetical protein